jgi:hypothetical protein
MKRIVLVCAAFVVVTLTQAAMAQEEAGSLAFSVPSIGGSYQG